VQIVDAAPTPYVRFDHARKRMAVVSYPALPSIELLAEPLLRLAGVRINPDRTQRQKTRYYESIELVDVDGSRRVAVETPAGAKLGLPIWSPDSRHVAFTITVKDGVELWVASTEDGKARRLLDQHLNTTLGDAITWLPEGKGLLVKLVVADRGPAPPEPVVPSGPIVEETAGREAKNRTYQDLLQTEYDIALFDHYFTTQLARVQVDGSVSPLGKPGIFLDSTPSPDGTRVLIEKIRGPYSRSVPYYRFAHTIEVWELETGDARVLADKPVADEVPIEGVPTGMRSTHWIPTQPATLVWAETLDGGDPNADAEKRDKLSLHAHPFRGESTEFARLTHRYSGIDWFAEDGRYLISEYDRDRRWITTHLRRLDDSQADTVFVDRSIHDRYADAGDPVYQRLPSGKMAVRVDDGHIYLDGPGATPQGDRPFLDKVPLAGGEPTRLFQSPDDEYATFIGFAGEDASRLVFRRESPSEPPNYYVREGDSDRPLTEFPHPHPQLSNIEKQLLTYERKDGVPLSGTLYLPPNRKEGEKLPLVVWAYPREFKDKKTAGQVRAAPTRFTRLSGTSPLMFLTQGYAVLNGAAMPVVGDPETMNDTFVEQITWDGQAAIDAVAKLGVADPDRVGVGGHSYGAFMTANLLAHTDLFRAGIARSGAYNRSLTPFGFQSERRTLWEAPHAYMRVSPLFNAHTLDEPILMFHGEIDNNSGTFPIQSKRLFHALQGLGGTARLVMLPHESHGYRSRESVLHVLAQSFEWFDQHVKNAGPREPKG
jgi:dipeptidyl aminopeptidase/acylaminoacyl peptidase